MALTLSYEPPTEYQRPTPGDYHAELTEIKVVDGSDYTTKLPKKQLLWKFDLVKSLTVDNDDQPLPVVDEQGHTFNVAKFTDMAYKASERSPGAVFITSLLGKTGVLSAEEVEAIDWEKLVGQRYRLNVQDKVGKESGKTRSDITSVTVTKQYPVDLKSLKAPVSVAAKTTAAAIETDPFEDQ